MMENSAGPQTGPPGPLLAKPQPVNRVEHYWLCGPCSAELTLIDDDGRVTVVPKIKKRAVAAAS